jgi:hypothetical protein
MVAAKHKLGHGDLCQGSQQVLLAGYAAHAVESPAASSCTGKEVVWLRGASGAMSGVCCDEVCWCMTAQWRTLPGAGGIVNCTRPGCAGEEDRKAAGCTPFAMLCPAAAGVQLPDG